MDDKRFDDVLRALGRSRSRREALEVLVAAGVAGVAGAVGGGEAGATSKGKGKAAKRSKGDRDRLPGGQLGAGGRQIFTTTTTAAPTTARPWVRCQTGNAVCSSNRQCCSGVCNGLKRNGKAAKGPDGRILTPRCASGTTTAAPGCGLATCPLGCCNGSTCVPFADQSDASCGIQGLACAPCGAGFACNTTTGGCFPLM